MGGVVVVVVDLSTYDSSSSQEFRDLAWNIMEEIGRPNISDFFPLIKALDLQGVRRSLTTSFSKMLQVFDKIIDERLRDQINSKDDVLATLLSLVKQNELTLDDVRHMLIVSTKQHILYSFGFSFLFFFFPICIFVFTTA
uniref:Uncharacterized protein n=1 Tax=Opuntia streptacantha TaxID=393608 RepID=A0A7C9E9X0_OPUST